MSESSAVDESWEAVPMSPDDVFSALSNGRRRIVILSVARSDGRVGAGDLAVEIAAIEHEIHPDTVSGQQRAAVYVTLVQNHLPKLDKLGVVKFDERSKQVEAQTATEPLARVIQSVEAACYDVGGGEDEG